VKCLAKQKLNKNVKWLIQAKKKADR
jgi:hypothetical protein